MGNMLQSGATWLAGKLKQSAGRAVTYARRGALITGLTGTVNSHEYEVVEGSGFLTSVTSFDWTFTTADLLLSGGLIEPRPGDLITETLGGVLSTYEVMDIGTKPCSEWLDTSGIMTLIHTRPVPNG